MKSLLPAPPAQALPLPQVSHFRVRRAVWQGGSSRESWHNHRWFPLVKRGDACNNELPLAAERSAASGKCESTTHVLVRSVLSCRCAVFPCPPSSFWPWEQPRLSLRRQRRPRSTTCKSATASRPHAR